MLKCLLKLTMIPLLLSCGSKPVATKKTAQTDQPRAVTQISSDSENIIPSRQIRRLTLDLQNRLPNKHDFEIFTSDVDNADNLISFFLNSNEADEAFAKLHKNIWKLWTPNSLISLSTKDSSLSAALANTHSSLVSDEPTKILRFLLGNNLSFEKLFLTKFTLMTTETAVFYGQSTSISPASDAGSLNFSNISRPNLGMLSTFGWYASLSSASNMKNHIGAAESIEKLSCVNLRSAEAHNFKKSGITEIDGEMIKISSTNEHCTSCHNQFYDLAEGLPLFGKAGSFSQWKTYNSNDFLQGHIRGKKYADTDELAEVFSNDSRVLNCELKQLTEELLQRPIDSLKDQYMIETLHQQWVETRNLKALIKGVLSLPEYKHQLLGGSGVVKTNSMSGIRILGPTHWQGFISQFLPYTSLEKLSLENPALVKSINNLEVISIADLTPRQEWTPYSSDFLPSEKYAQAHFDLALKIANAAVENELQTSILARSRNILKLLPDNEGYSTLDDEINSQILSIWQDWTSIKANSDDPRLKKIKAVYDETIQSGTTTLDRSRNAWKWVLVSILMSPEFIIY